MSLPTVGLWRRNFSERGLDGLADAPRSGHPRQIDDDEVQVGRASWCPEPREPRPDLRPVPRRESRQYEYLLEQL
jgi:transposase